jgi:glycosyltransferase involved in cell wall biosynthesis
VVEPQESAEYVAQYGTDRVLVLPKDNQGILFSRNFCKRHARDSGAKWHWQIDDDLISFSRRVGIFEGKFKAKRCDALEALLGVQSFVTQFKNVAAACPKAQGAVFNEPRPFIVNQLIYTCGLFRTDVDAWWRVIPGDTDYSLQVLKQGWVTLLCFQYLQHSASSDAIAGGMQESRGGSKGRLNHLRNLKKLWPNDISLVECNHFGKSSGRARWSQFKQLPILNNGKVVQAPKR